MNRFDLILRDIVFFVFPIPFLLSFAMEHYGDWTAYVAYATALRLGYLPSNCLRRLSHATPSVQGGKRVISSSMASKNKSRAVEWN
jgi:hypothetical protein